MEMTRKRREVLMERGEPKWSNSIGRKKKSAVGLSG